MPEDPTVAAVILRRLNILLWATAVLAVIVLATAGFSVGSAINATSRADDANTALCTFRGDYKDRVKRTEDFIVAHPAGALGFTPQQLDNQLRQQRRTVESLALLDCPEGQ